MPLLPLMGRVLAGGIASGQNRDSLQCLYIQASEQAGPRERTRPMTQHYVKQVPISLRSRQKSDVRTQFAALCYRITKDKPEFLMVTSRGTRRWIVPKGWPEDGKTPGEAALREAWEEAGVIGRVTGPCLGLFSYHKVLQGERGLPCVAMVYPVRVRALADDYPEKDERKRKWMRPKKAATKVEEPELAQIIRSFDPRLLRG